MTPREAAAVEAVARDLDKMSLRWAAARLRAIVEAEVDDERPCRVQDRAGQVAAIPWGLAEILYPAYGHGQTLEELASRGGFGRSELGMLACDNYSGTEDRPRPRLARMPLLDLYEMARAGLRRAES